MKRLLLFGFLFAMITTVIISCQKELSYETDQNLGHGTLYDSFKSCQPMVPSGTYYDGVYTDRDTNYVKIIVTVTQTGAYNLNTGIVNGFSFSDSGYFPNLGLDTILLHAHGTPILNVPTDFSLTLDSSTCGFTIIVQDSTGTGLGGTGGGVVGSGDSSFIDPSPAATNTWHFTDSTTGLSYNGSFNVASTTPPEGGFFQGDTLIAIGQTTAIDTLFGLTLIIPSQSIVAGKIYPVNANNTIVLQTSADQNDFYAANDFTAAEGANSSYITITTWDATTRQLSGSFHAWAEFNGVSTLIAGSFNTTVH